MATPEASGAPETESVIYVEPRALHESGFLAAMRANSEGYREQLAALRDDSGDEVTPEDVLREVLDHYADESLETLSPVIDELERRNQVFDQKRLVERRKEATEEFLSQVQSAFADVADKIDMDTSEFERRCVDPVTVVVELPEPTRDALRNELEMFYALRAGGDGDDLPANPSLQTLVTRCVQAARRSTA